MSRANNSQKRIKIQKVKIQEKYKKVPKVKCTPNCGNQGYIQVFYKIDIKNFMQKGNFWKNIYKIEISEKLSKKGNFRTIFYKREISEKSSKVIKMFHFL